MTRIQYFTQTLMLTLALALLTGCSGSSDPDPDPGPTPGAYPTAMAKPSENILSQLREAFWAENPRAYCVTLNDYGLMDYDGLADCWVDSGSAGSLEDELPLVRAMLERNRDYTFILPESNLALIQSHFYEDRWTLSFDFQYQDNIPVVGSEMWVVWFGDDTFMASGHHFPQAYLPDIEVDAITAGNAMLGRDVHFVFGNDGEYQETFRIESLEGEPTLVLYPFDNPATNSLEMRLCWQWKIIYHNTSFSWAFADVTDGQFVEAWEPYIVLEDSKRDQLTMEALKQVRLVPHKGQPLMVLPKYLDASANPK